MVRYSQWMVTPHSIPYGLRRKPKHSALKFTFCHASRPGQPSLSPLPVVTNSPPSIPFLFCLPLGLQWTQTSSGSSVIPGAGQELHRAPNTLDRRSPPVGSLESVGLPVSVCWEQTFLGVSSEVRLRFLWLCVIIRSVMVTH